jgi:hypothetical protein
MKQKLEKNHDFFSEHKPPGGVFVFWLLSNQYTKDPPG